MDDTVHEGNEGREGGDGEERPHFGILPPNLQASLPSDEAGFRFRRRHAGPQAADGDCSPPPARERPG